MLLLLRPDDLQEQPDSVQGVHELRKNNGFGDVQAAAELVAVLYFAGIVGCREHDNRYVPQQRVILDPFERFDTVHAGHVDVEQQEKIPDAVLPFPFAFYFFEIGQNFFAVAKALNFVVDAGTAQAFHNKLGVAVVVFGNQNLHFRFPDEWGCFHNLSIKGSTGKTTVKADPSPSLDSRKTEPLC